MFSKNSFAWCIAIVLKLFCNKLFLHALPRRKARMLTQHVVVDDIDANPCFRQVGGLSCLKTDRGWQGYAVLTTIAPTNYLDEIKRRRYWRGNRIFKIRSLLFKLYRARVMKLCSPSIVRRLPNGPANLRQ